MNSKAQAPVSNLDNLKLGVALVILAAAIGGFYYYSDKSVLLRVLAILGAAAVSLAIALQTEKGRLLAGFFKEAQVEVRKVVWPTRQETVQTTLVVVFVVVIVAIGLWLLDMLLSWLVRSLTAMGA